MTELNKGNLLEMTRELADISNKGSHRRMYYTLAEIIMVLEEEYKEVARGSYEPVH